jgi:hypothetical protein
LNENFSEVYVAFNARLPHGIHGIHRNSAAHMGPFEIGVDSVHLISIYEEALMSMKGRFAQMTPPVQSNTPYSMGYRELQHRIQTTEQAVVWMREITGAPE